MNQINDMVGVNRKDIRQKKIDSWVYPEISNMEKRKYQFDIIKNSLFKNTLICLPTGLGKTFISSCIMYNFHVWFHGKIFFCAPTKSLITQQKEGFLKIFTNLKDLVVQITGSNKDRIARIRNYKYKKIFFMTPQTLYNDLITNNFSGSEISLVIFDEAHKAIGKYAYNEIIRFLSQDVNNCFRIIALTATPGSNLENIQSMITTLKINQTEIKTFGELREFAFYRNIEIIDIENNDNLELIEKYINDLIHNRLVRLNEYKLIDNTNCKYFFIKKLLEIRKTFNNKLEEFKYNYGENMVNEIFDMFSILFQLMMCKKMLRTGGIISFKLYFQKLYRSNNKNNKYGYYLSGARKLIIKHNSFKKIVQILKSMNQNPIDPNIALSTNRLDNDPLNKNLINTSKLNENNLNSIPDSDESNEPKQVEIHPKLKKLWSIIDKEKENIINEYQVIIFTHFKETAKEIFEYLNNFFSKEIEISILTGQSFLLRNIDQNKIVEDFRQGKTRIMISTNVGEEGLDFGSVDLIICYDVITSSPIKLMQRFGRTGRKRDGKIIIFLTKGEEKGKYFNSLYKLKKINLELIKLKNLQISKLKLCNDPRNNLFIPDSIKENVKLIKINDQEFEDISSNNNEGILELDIKQECKNQRFSEIRLSDFEDQISANNKLENNDNKILSFQIFNKKSKGGVKFESKVVVNNIPKNKDAEQANYIESNIKKTNKTKKEKRVTFDLSNLQIETIQKELEGRNINFNEDSTLFFHKHLISILGGLESEDNFLQQKRVRKIKKLIDD